MDDHLEIGLNKENLQMLISKLGMKQADFAKKIGVSPPTINHIMSGRNKISMEVIGKIKKVFPKIPYEWLMENKGSLSEILSNEKNLSPTINKNTSTKKNDVRQKNTTIDDDSSIDTDDNNERKQKIIDKVVFFL